MNLFLLMLITTSLVSITQSGFCTAATPLGAVCNEIEKEALLSFKSGLVDPSNRLASWVGSRDCCGWAGVVCHNVTGHVLELHLATNITYPDPDDYDSNIAFVDAIAASCLRGEISASLLNLRRLNYLDLSTNDFGGIQIPVFLGSMRSLRHLNLSFAGFGGMVPPQLGNLSDLLYLNIGYEDRYRIYVENIHWLSGFSILTHLDLSLVDLSNARDWVQQTNALSSLKELHLQGCLLGNDPRSPYTNSSRLEFLDLSQNSITSYSFLGMYNSLVSLDISQNFIGGPLPNVLRNLTSLRDLELSANNFISLLPSWMNDLSRLEKLTLGGNYDLQGVVSDQIGNLTSLTHLDISSTNLQLEVKGSLRMLCSLQWVDLSDLRHKLELTHLFNAFVRCSSDQLQYLSLSSCGLTGFITDIIGSLTSLKHLDLSFNQLNGTIPTSMGQLIRLEYLDLSSNLLRGTTSEAFFNNLTRLQVLLASDNQVAMIVGPDWIPPFQLKKLKLSSWQLGPDFPKWLRSQQGLSYLDLGDTGINDRVPTWIWDRSYRFLDLSGNNLHGKISAQIVSAWFLDLSSNNLEGLLPSLSSRTDHIDFSNNSFSGPISQLLCYREDEPKEMLEMNLGDNQLSGEIPDCWLSWQNLSTIQLQNNNLTGNIPDSLGSLSHLELLLLSNNSLSGVVPRSLQNCTSLQTLDLSRNLLSGPISQFLCSNIYEEKKLMYLRLGYNQLSGNIPDCWRNWPNLWVIELQQNELTGHLPDSIGSLRSLAGLHLQTNNLSGELPPSLRNCSLEFVDIGENSFGGGLPKWIGGFTGMRLLGLRSNNFEGNIPHELCSLQGLQIFDTANNNLSGQIPTCILNFSRMSDERLIDGGPDWGFVPGSYPGSYIKDSATNLVNKGSSREYTTNLRYMVAIDLSNNSLSGQIPEQITNLAAVVSLDLSRNKLNGRIPKNMGNMSALESLDLSFNQLSGEIPQSMASMAALSFLNLSYNNLTGTIPSSTQFSTFSQSSFLGNNLSVAATPATSNKGSRNGSALVDHDHHGVEFDEFYVSMVVGFVVGFGIVVGPLLYSRAWRMIYFQTISSTSNWLWEVLVLPSRVRLGRQV